MPAFALPLLCAMLGLAAMHARAQEAPRGVVGPAGGTSSAGGAILSWTLGDVSAGSFRVPGLQYREGFQSGILRVTSVDPLPLRWGVEVFPNPAQSTLSVAFAEGHPDLVLELHDMSGRALLRADVQRGAMQQTLYLRDLPAGTYLLRVLRDDGVSAGRFQIKKIP